MSYTDHTNPDTALEYDRVAPDYDQRFSNSFDRAEEEFIFDQFRNHIRAADILDIGCGTGLVKRLADMDLFKPRSYVGIDYSAKMIEQAKFNHPDARFFLGDMLEIMDAMAPESFDTVVAMYCPLNYCEHHHSKVYASVKRILREGGVFINVVASSRYAVRKSHVVSAGNMRRYFDEGVYHIKAMEDQFLLKRIIRTNFAIEKYRPWLQRCPKAVNKMLFKFDSDQFTGGSGKTPLLYTFILEKFM